ncbi:MAG: hypothetical protein GY715_02040 [Planctomycetes bacterium]|nr:hypothetical protein [Planctomycetota bacterium]
MPRRLPRKRTAAVVALVAIVLLIVFAPAIVDRPMAGLLARAIEKRVNADVSIAELDLTWTGPQAIRGLRLEHGDGTEVANLDVTLDEGLLDTWRGTVDGWDLDVGGRVHVDRGADKSWTWIDVVAKEREAGGETSTPQAMRVRVNGLSVRVQAQSGDDIEVEDLKGTVTYEPAGKVAIDLDGRSSGADVSIHGAVDGTLELKDLPGGTLAPFAALEPALLRELTGGPIVGTLVTSRTDGGLDMKLDASSPRAEITCAGRWADGAMRIDSGQGRIQVRPELLELLDDDDDRAFSLAGDTQVSIDVEPFTAGSELIPIAVSVDDAALTGKALAETVTLAGLAGKGTVDPDEASVSLAFTAELQRSDDATRIGEAELDLDLKGIEATVVVKLTDLSVRETGRVLARAPDRLEELLGSTGAVTIADTAHGETSPTSVDVDFQRLKGRVTVTYLDGGGFRVKATSQQLSLIDGEEKREIGEMTLDLDTRADGTTVAKLHAVNTPTIIHDSVLGAHGLLVAAIGPTADLEGTLTAKDGQWISVESRLTVPGGWAEINLDRADGVVRTRADGPLRAELEVRPELCEQVLTYVHPVLGDICTTAAPIRATISNVKIPVDGDLAGLDADVEILIGAAELDAHSGILAPLGIFQAVLGGLTDSASASRCQTTVPGSVEAMRASIRGGVVTYDEFVIYAGEHRLPYTGEIDLGAKTLDIQTEVSVSALGPTVQKIGIIPTGITLPIRTHGTFENSQTNVDIGKAIGNVPGSILRGISGGK